jgi:cation diffusion facilitator CzcD-associated flavoprotein CzcO
MKFLGISHLIIEKADAPGASWANRYETLSLHNLTEANSFPYLPFPDMFPDFIRSSDAIKKVRN